MGHRHHDLTLEERYPPELEGRSVWPLKHTIAPTTARETRHLKIKTPVKESRYVQVLQVRTSRASD